MEDIIIMNGHKFGYQCPSGEKRRKDCHHSDRRLRECEGIYSQYRPNIFDLAIRKPGVYIVLRVVEVEERITLTDYIEDPEQNITNTEPREKYLRFSTL